MIHLRMELILEQEEEYIIVVRSIVFLFILIFSKWTISIQSSIAL
jgi:hypothetical protein